MFREQRIKVITLTGSPWGGRRGRRVNVVEIMYRHVCKCKMILVETVPEIGEVG
jgi:hypothetical protein